MEVQRALFIGLDRLSCLLVDRHEVFEFHLYDFIIIWPLGFADIWSWIWVSSGWRLLWNVRRLVCLMSDIYRYRTIFSSVFQDLSILIRYDLRERLLDVNWPCVVDHGHGFFQFLFLANILYQRLSQCWVFLEPWGTMLALIFHSFIHLEEIFVSGEVSGLAACCIGHQNTFFYLCVKLLSSKVWELD